MATHQGHLNYSGAQLNYFQQ
jgi:hypothetical protein